MAHRQPLSLFVVLTLILSTNAFAQGEIAPLRMINNNPLFIIYGLPRIGSARLLDAGKQKYRLLTEASSYYAIEKTTNERLELDGEVYTSVFSWEYGISTGFQLALEIPYIRHTGGTLDGFINEWHGLFDLPEGGRNFVPNDRYLLHYQRYGTDLIQHTQPGRGIGDVSIIGAWQGSSTNVEDPWSVGVSINFATGDSQQFHGNGYTDVAMWLSQQFKSTFYNMHSGSFYSLGFIYIEGSDVLPQFVNSSAAFGEAGVGVYVTSSVLFITQMDLHSPLYSGPEVHDLNGYGAQLSVGGTVFLDSGAKIHISVGEDLSLDVTPDITFHLGYEWEL